MYKKTLGILKHLSSESFQSKIKKSLKDFETNSEGSTVDFFYEHDWEEKLINNSENNNRKLFLEKLLPKLRN